jgi:predicted nucleotidyltransferase
MLKFVEDNLIYKIYSGSIAYGLNTPESDIDIRGITIPPLEFYLGLQSFEQQEISPDTVIYALRKFIRLANNCNPNIIEMLFVDKKDILFINKYGKLLRENRNLFLSTKARFTFGGYAFAQLKKIKGHRKWITNPQIKPEKKHFFKRKIAILEDGSKKPYMKFSETEYDLAMKKYHQYIEWKKNRNPDRAKLEDKYGYDCKHAMHLIRLLRMGCEILEKGTVIVKRPDRGDLLAIRNGKLSYGELIKQAEDYQNKLDELYKVSPLPKNPNSKEIEKLLIDITEEFLYGR